MERSAGSFAKRVFDVSVSLPLLALLSPVLGTIAIWIRLDSPGPVFYRGERIGRNGKKFHMLKFRSMVTDADKIGATSTAEDDPRITKSGHFVRRYKLDELPQLINVLRGEMSLVGPRPQVAWAVELYNEEEKKLLSVKPGITDWASIKFRNEGELLKGSQDPDKDYLEKIAPEKIRLGLEYVRTRSMKTDIRILAKTFTSLLSNGA